MKIISNEFKAGLMIIICIIALFALTLTVGDFNFFEEGYKLDVKFNFASGIKKNAPVQLAGVEVGTVKDILIKYGPEGTKVILQLWLDSSAKVKTDSDVYISTMGLMGEKYVEITRGSNEAPYLEPGSMVVGKDPIMMEEVMDKAVAVTDNLDKEIQLLMQLTENVDNTLQANRPDIDRIVDNLKSASDNFKSFTDDIKKNPWKLLIKTKPKRDRIRDDGTLGNKGVIGGGR
ncbi:MAG: MlaD family protein [Candidatus Omnitrophota bacterium]